jgi:hypothetical protein
MAVGLQSQADTTIHIVRILESATATTAVPVYASDGVDVGAILDSLYGGKPFPETAGLAIHTSAGSGTMTATIKLWAGVLGIGPSGAGKYLAASTGPGATAGWANGGVALDEHAADDIGRLDYILYPRLARKWAPQVVAIGGTGTAVSVDLIFAAVIA